MTVSVVSPTATLRSGPGEWWRSFSAMLRWQLASMRLVLPVMVMVQLLTASGISVGLSIFFDDIDPRRALYLGSGTSIVSLILVGLVVAPQLVAAEKEAGTYEYTWSLPVPRSAAAGAWVVVSAIVSLPAMVLGLFVAAWRLGLDYELDWSILPAVALVVVCGTLIGYAFAHAIENTNLTQILTQILAFGIFGFTPITYPLENLPQWMGSIHQVLPFYHMGVIVRAGLTDGLVSGVARSYAIVLIWAVASALVTAAHLGRRR